jgi:hypothetical protein
VPGGRKRGGRGAPADGGDAPATLRGRAKWRSVALKSAVGGGASIFNFDSRALRRSLI